MQEAVIHNANSHTRWLLALKLVKGIGNATAIKLLNQFSTAQAIFQASNEALAQSGLKASIITQIKSFDFSQIDSILQWQSQPNCHIIDFQSPFYPYQLKQINSPPFILFARGNLDLMLTPQLAVIGSRNPTMNGLQNTQSFCREIVNQGITITSGLAVGIDGEAHRTALAAKGYTIAVMGTGLNRIYPACHRELAYQIAERGLLLSEKLPDAPIDKGSFPSRNRIIAGLAVGTLVIEAAQNSGSLITAKCAMEEGREVFAIPGSIHNPLSKGCHGLIKQGAKLVENLQDIMEDLPLTFNSYKQPISANESINSLNDQDAAFLQLIDYEVTPIDLIIARSQLTVEAVTNKLLDLELSGLIINTAGGYCRR